MSGINPGGERENFAAIRRNNWNPPATDMEQQPNGQISAADPRSHRRREAAASAARRARRFDTGTGAAIFRAIRRLGESP